MRGVFHDRLVGCNPKLRINSPDNSLLVSGGPTASLYLPHRNYRRAAWWSGTKLMSTAARN